MASQAMGVMEKLLQEVNGESSSIRFNTQQCRCLRGRCLLVSDYLKLWRACNNQLKPPHLALEELSCLIRRSLSLLGLCRSDQSWLHHAAVRLNNGREFAALCLGLSKLTNLINSQMILAAADDMNSPEVQALISKPHQHTLFDDLESALEALNASLEVDSVELLLKAKSLPEVNSMLRHYILQKLDGKLPMLEPLELGNMIGGGAFGTVYRAEWMGIPVAVKEFREGDASFEKELNILKVLMLEPDPNVLQIIGYYHRDDKAYLVMELMEMDLAKVIRKYQSSLQMRDLIDIMLQIASGMLYLHERNVVHRDLKPSNILVNDITSTPTCINIRLTDFGFSKTNFVSFAPDLTYQRGTILYMAPEMFRGQKYSREVDVYSFGVTCFQLLTGKLPNGGQDHIMGEKLVEMLEAGYRPDLPINCPKELAVMINRCWNTNPKDRPNFQNITRILSSLKDKLLVAHFKEIELRDPSTAEDFANVAADLVGMICVAAPHTNLLQCGILKSRCMQVSGYLAVWNDLKLPSAVAVLRKLVATLKSALSLIESYSKECWLQSALTKLHNPMQFRLIVEDINWCADLLNFETEKLRSESQREDLKAHSFQTMSLDLLDQYAEADKARMVETANEIVSGSSRRASDGVNMKMAEYVLKKVAAQGVMHIEPEEIVLKNVLRFSKQGTVFKAHWLGIHVALKILKSTGLKDLDQSYIRLKDGHPNLTSILGYTKHGEDHFLVIEIADGGSLHLRSNVFPPILAVEVLHQLSRGIHYLHQNNLDLIKLDTILVDFERNEPDGFTGALRAKLAISSHQVGPLKPNVKSQTAYKFGATCFEMITGNAIEGETLLSGRVPELPRDCPSSIQKMIEKCSGSSPPDFGEITETLRLTKMEMERNSTSTDYRRMLLELRGTENDELELIGHGMVGEKLTVIGNIDQAQNRLYQWVRQHRDGTIERMKPFLVTGSEFETLEYTLTADDFNKGISLTCVDMNERIEMARRATTNARWITYSDSMKRAIKNSWDVGAARFKVTMQESNRKCCLLITKAYYVLSWKRLMVKTVVEKNGFSSAACIKISEEKPDVCSLINTSNRTWNIKFRDSFTRDLAVLTFRHFAKMNALSRRMNSRRIQ